MSHWKILILLFCAAIDAVCGQFNNDRQIYDRIFTSYSTDIRPLINSSQAITVQLKFELTKINLIDDVNQQMHVVGFYIAQWTDEFLVWNASDYGNIEKIVVPATMVWLPDFAIVNSANVFYHDEFEHDFRVLITSAGLVTWSFGGNIVVSCELDLTYYPFDNQRCYMAVENWHYDNSEVELVNATSEIEKDEYHTNGMWTVTGTSSQSSLIYHSAFPGIAYPLVKFELFITRKAGYYVLNILAPCLLLAILSLMVSWLPPNAGGKLGMGVTIIVGFSVFALMVSQNTPRTSDAFPLLSIWMNSLMIISGFNTVMTMVVLYCSNHLAYRPSAILRSIFIKTLGRVLCVGGMPKEVDDEVQEITSTLNITDVESIPKQPIGDSKSERSQSEQRELIERVTQVLGEIKIISESIKVGQLETTAQDEWMAIGLVIDRLCFWIKFGMIMLATVVCFTVRE